MNSPVEVTVSMVASSCPARAPGMGRSSTPSIQPNTVVFAAMAMASVNTATSVNPGFPRSIRTPKRRSWKRERILVSGKHFRVRT